MVCCKKDKKRGTEREREREGGEKGGREDTIEIIYIEKSGYP